MSEQTHDLATLGDPVPPAWQREVQSIDRTARLLRFAHVWVIVSKPEDANLHRRRAAGYNLVRYAHESGQADPITLGVATAASLGYGVCALEAIPELQVPVLIQWFREVTHRVQLGNVDQLMDETEARSDGRMHTARREASIRDYLDTEGRDRVHHLMRGRTSLLVKGVDG